MHEELFIDIPFYNSSRYEDISKEFETYDEYSALLSRVKDDLTAPEAKVIHILLALSKDSEAVTVSEIKEISSEIDGKVKQILSSIYSKLQLVDNRELDLDLTKGVKRVYEIKQ